MCVCVFTGQERFGNMTRVYYREAVGAFIVFDVTRPTTFEAVTKWKEDLNSKLTLADGQSVATVLLANKCDQGREFTHNGVKMEQFCKDHGFVGWFQTSAKVRPEAETRSSVGLLLDSNGLWTRWFFLFKCAIPESRAVVRFCFVNVLPGRGAAVARMFPLPLWSLAVRSRFPPKKSLRFSQILIL